MSSTPEQSIGKRIQALRRQRGSTLQKLAERTGLSKGLLSKIENGKVSSPISTYLNIAHALGAKIAYFLQDEAEDQSFVRVRKNERQRHNEGLAQFGYGYEALAHNRKEKIMEPFILTVDHRFSKPVVFSHPGEEFNFLLEGKVLFKYGSEQFILEKGDSYYFDASVPHVGISIGKKPAKALVVFTTGEKNILNRNFKLTSLPKKDKNDG